MYFTITDQQGKIFAKKSGDLNKIHTDEITGYNSLYGEKICHGCLVFLKTINLNYFKNKINQQNIFKIKITFNKHFSYNKRINLKVKKNFYSLVQDNIVRADINLEKVNFNNNIKANFNYSKKIKLILQNISRYTGMVYPGKNSILNQIEIYYDYRNKFYSNFKIKSKKIDKRTPIIYNELRFDKFNVKFQSLVRPALKKNKDKINKEIIYKVNSVKRNAIIIGASQGVGNNFLNILKINKKITIVATYFKNKINSNKNVMSKKIDVNKDLSKLRELINKYCPINVYYFPSCKIFFHNFLTKEQKKQLKKYFLDIPIKIIKMNQKKNINFFYPSTKYININKNSFYSKIKINAEKKITLLCKRLSIKHKIIRFDAIQSRQTINIKGNKIPTLYDYLKNKRLNINSLLLLN